MQCNTVKRNSLRENVRPIAHWATIRLRLQASAPGVSARERQIRAANVCTLTLATHTQQFSMRCSVYGNVSRDARANPQTASSSEFFDEDDHFIYSFIAAGVAVEMLESEQKARKKKESGLELDEL